MDSNRLSAVNKIYMFLFAITDIFGVGNYYTSGNFTTKSSKLLRIYGLTLLSAISIFFLCNVQSVKLLYTENRETSLLFFEYVSYWSMSILCFASSICQQNKIREWTKKTRKIILHFTKDQLNQLRIGFLVSTLAGFLLLITFTTVFYLDNTQPDKTIFSLFSYITLYGIITIIVLQFVLSVLFLTLLFRNINEELGGILAESRAREGECDETCLFFVEYRHLLKKDFVLNQEITRIRELSERHGLCCSLMRDVNDCFSPQLLFINGLCFLEITYSIFCFTLDDVESIPFSVNFIFVWFCTYASFLFAYTVSSQQLMDQAMKSGSLVHRIIIVESRKSIKNVLEIFSMQIYQSDVLITAMGLFTVNSSLLYEMVGGVTSATVLLIQFQKYSFPEAEGTTIASHNTAV